MFPIKDSIPARRPPVMNVALIAANVLVFWIEVSLSGETLEWVFRHFGVVPASYAGTPGWESLPGKLVWAPLTSMFLHGGWFHLVSNMWMLWIFGDNVEDRMGPVRYLLFYLLCGAVAAFTHIASDPQSAVPTVGASGAIAGVLGAYVLMYPRARVLTVVPILFLPFFFDVTALFFIGLWFILQVISATWMMRAPEEVGGVAFWAHIGGFVCGLLLVKLFCSAGCHPRKLQADEWTWEDVWRRMR